LTETLAETAAMIVAAGGPESHLLAADLTRPAEVDKLAGEALGALPGLDILVSNAGGSRPLSSSDAEAAWEEAFELNFTSARRLTTMLLDPIKATGRGRVIVVTGAWTTRTINAATPAKAALSSWARTLSFELAPHGVTVNCLAPGRINSRQVRERLHPTPDSRDGYIADNIPLGRFGTPEEFGFMAACLASPRAAYVSGAMIPIDGGMIRLA